MIRENLDIGRPSQVQLLFDRRITRRTPGRFRTRVITDGVTPSLHIEYKHSHIKQYHKEGRALRTETTSACALGLRTMFLTAAGLVTTFGKALYENRLEERLKLLTQPKLLIIDEIGYIPIDRQGANLFFQLISRRYEKGSILLTSNQSLGAWGEVFGDTVIASAILDCLLHHTTTINSKGDSYRLKEKPAPGCSAPPQRRRSRSDQQRGEFKMSNGGGVSDVG